MNLYFHRSFCQSFLCLLIIWTRRQIELGKKSIYGYNFSTRLVFFMSDWNYTNLNRLTKIIHLWGFYLFVVDLFINENLFSCIWSDGVGPHKTFVAYTEVWDKLCQSQTLAEACKEIYTTSCLLLHCPRYNTCRTWCGVSWFRVAIGWFRAATVY